MTSGSVSPIAASNGHKRMTSRSFVERVEMEDSFVLELVTCESADGPCYHVLLMPAQRVEELRRSLSAKDVELADYGEVLASGEGREPPAGMIEELRGLITKK